MCENESMRVYFYHKILCTCIAVIVIVGQNKTVIEDQGSVDICFVMNIFAEIPIFVAITFSENNDLAKHPAQGRPFMCYCDHICQNSRL